ncbi:hypothetical protein EGT74_24580 [Chitinophaga lutea]|uniref:Uncharacterized protein n=1 Tax=Chitinophaga lutea TaxID=2488634 RepID=A0A3N4PA86_9BACT|nr:hypothetical protein [Chitinophaga lutea]RPE05563.1 hypothetical protein EGT74_24580 [Chitinophaga lutea]
MATINNYIRSELNIVDQRGASWVPFTFTCNNENGNLIDWSTAQEIRADVMNSIGTIVASFTAGDGLTIKEGVPTELVMEKPANRKDLPPGVYHWDLLVQFTNEVAQCPVGGSYVVKDRVTIKTV